MQLTLLKKIVLLGNADDIVQYLCEALGWELPPLVPPDSSPKSNTNTQSVRETSGSDKQGPRVSKVNEPECVGDRLEVFHHSGVSRFKLIEIVRVLPCSHVWLFDGAEGGRWLEELKRDLEAPTPPSLTPLVVDSGANTRLPSPLLATAPDTVYKKREFVDVDEKERSFKKAKP